MTHTNGAPLPIALVGLGGYGATICRLLEEQSRVPDPPVRLVGVFEPDVATHGARLAELREAGIATASSYAELLAGPSEAVWLPIPIHLHRPFTEQALAAGKAVLCEKPVAGAVEDLAAMRAARDHAGRPVAIGFQDLYDPATHAIKRRLLDGAIGQPRAATLLACWPRDSSYYGRNAWAGAFRRDGIWVMDSPLSNAISHYANLALFWLGDAPAATAVPLAVDAELYRANPIENYDTCALRVHLAGGHTLAHPLHPRLPAADRPADHHHRHGGHAADGRGPRHRPARHQRHSDRSQDNHRRPPHADGARFRRLGARRAGRDGLRHP